MTMESINDDSIEAALNFIRDKSHAIADARARAKFLEQRRKSLKAVAFLEATGTVAERESVAYSDAEYLKCVDDYKQAVYDSELLSCQMKAAELRIEVWRTLAANNRIGVQL